jgi:hypothetical protein
VPALLAYIRDLDEETFKRFVNDEKNDFANWIKNCVGDKELATRIWQLQSKNDVTRELRDKLLRAVQR